jgi:predicted GNAT family N-acyltransferase
MHRTGTFLNSPAWVQQGKKKGAAARQTAYYARFGPTRLKKMLCSCGAVAVYYDGTFSCHACVGAYNVAEQRWVQTDEEIFDTASFIDYTMPMWNKVPDTVQLTIVRNTHDKNTERWIGLQLGKLSMRNGVRVYTDKSAYPMRDGWSVVITAHYENKPPKLLAFTSFTVDGAKEATIGWYISGQVEVDGKRTGLGALLIMTSVYLAKRYSAESMSLQAINEQVAQIYESYGFEVTDGQDPDDMQIPDIDRAIEEYEYEDRTRAFIRTLEGMLETDDQRRQFYNSIQTSYDRLLPTSLKAESIWQFASIVVKNLVGNLRDAPTVHAKAMAIRWGNLIHSYAYLPDNSSFKHAKRAIALGRGTIEFARVCAHLRRVAELVSLDVARAEIESDPYSSVIVLPERYTDRSFLPALIFLYFLHATQSYGSVRFLNLGDTENFLENFTAKRHVNYYYPLDVCVSDLASFETTVERIEDIAFDVKGSGVHGFDVYCTAAYVTPQARKLCKDRKVILFDPVVVPTIEDTVDNFGLRAKDEGSAKDSRIAMVADYIDYRKLPVYGVSNATFALSRDVPVTKETYNATFNLLSGVESSNKPKNVLTDLPLFDLSDLIVEAMLTGDSALPPVFVSKLERDAFAFEPVLRGKGARNVFSYIATLDPAALKVNPVRT